MFRLQEGHLPKDHQFPADLKELGFFVNDAGQFRMIDYPDKDFQYRYSNIDRANEVRREAYQSCQRKEVASRLSALGLVHLYLPQLTTTKPENEPSVPILAPPPAILKKRKRIVVLINDHLQDLGILAYRRLQRELGVNGGSVVNFAKELIKRSSADSNELDGLFDDGFDVKDEGKHTPGLVVLNCGQLLYSYKDGEAKTVRSWIGMPRPSAFHDAVEIHAENKIEGNHDAAAHVRFVFENVLNNRDFVHDTAEIYVIAIESGAETFLNMLDADFDKYTAKLAALALIDSHVSSSQLTNPSLKSFLRRRARQWKIDSSTNNPRQCIEMPATYAQELDILDSALKLQPRPKRKSPKALRAAQANEIQLQAREPVAVSAAPLPRPRPAANANVEDEGEGAAADDQDYDFEDYDPVCPTFADDENPFAAGECIFTAPSVQHCILDFFEEVAVAEKGATGYRNPVFRVAAVVSADVGEKDDDEDDAALKSPEEPPVKIELKLKRAELAHMRASLASTSRTDPLLAAGRCNLEQRIRAKEAEVKGWERKVLAAGAFGPGEGEEVRREAEREALELKRREREEREKENKGTGWEKVDLGPKVKFAGTVVERELLRKAGLDGVEEMEVREVAEGVGRLELDGDGE